MNTQPLLESRRLLIRVAASAVYILAVLYAVIFAGGTLNLVTALLILFAAAYMLLKKSVRFPKSVFISGAFFFLFMTVSSIFSISPRRSFEQTWILIAAAFFTLFLANIQPHKKIREYTLVSLLLAGAIGMSISWRSAIQWYLTWRATSGGQAVIPDLPYRLNGGNVIAAFYSILFFIALILFLRVKTGWIRVVMAGYWVSVSVLLLLSTSRGAWVGMIIGLLALMILEKQYLIKAYRFIRRSRVLTIAVLVVLLILLVVFALFYQKYVASHPTHGAGMNRSPFWQPAWKAFLSSPLIGNGPYTGGSFYIQSASVPWSAIYLHAHNTYLDVLRDTGILGFISFCVFLFFLIRAMVKNFFANREDLFTEIALCAAAAFLAHSFFDGNYLMPFTGASMVILTGLALNPGQAEQAGGMQIKPAAVALGIVALAGAVFLLWSRWTLTGGIEHYQRGDLARSLAAFEKSTRYDSGNPVGFIYHGLVAASLAENGQPEYLEIARKDFETAFRLDPNWAVTQANLAALHRSTGEVNLAKSFFDRSQRLAPNWYVPKLNLGLIAEEEGNDRQAKDYYLAALRAYPQIAGSSFWNTTLLRRNVLGEWLNANPPMTLSTDDYAAVMAQESPIPMIELGLQLADTNVELAKRLSLRSRLVFSPYPSIHVERAWLEAELSAKQGDIDEAEIVGEAALASLREDGLYGPGSAGTSLYSDGLYRAPTLPVEFVPQLITISLPGEWEGRLYRLAEWEMMNNHQADCVDTIEFLLRAAPEYLTDNRIPSPCRTD